MRPNWLVQLLFVVSLAAFSTACQPTCERLCVANAEYIDGCLEYWDAVWPDFGYHPSDGETGADAYYASCTNRYQNAIKFSGIESGRTIREGCQTNLQAVTSAIGCSDYRPSFVDLDPTDDTSGVAPPAESN